MGAPPSPTAAQLARLEQAGQLARMDGPGQARVESGQARLSFTLPRQAVSLIVLAT
jgi:hypothetical protein